MIKNLTAFCRLFYATTFIPVVIRRYDPDATDFFPSAMRNFGITPPALSKALHFTKNPDYYITASSCYLGYVKLTDSNDYMLIGPICPIPITTQAIHEFMHEWGIPSDMKQDISLFLTNTPQISFHQFLHILAYLFLCLNDAEIDIGNHFCLESNAIGKKISQSHSDLIFESRETRDFHNTYYFERELLQYIQDGETENLKLLLRQHEYEISAGTLADNSLRQEKNLFIVTLALATRSAVSGGLDIEQAYSLSDTYIKECEQMQNIMSVSNLMGTALIDFAKRVSQNKVPAGMSKEVFDCIQFIQRHTHETIQVNDVAKHIKRSRSYITLKFKEELGFDISSFIMRCKLEEAKSLLTYSEKTLGEISSYLGFSSQGYFQNVFKKKYGLTPMQYRNQTTKY